jgi:hypothetical protein
MNLINSQKRYVFLIFCLFLLPNIFVVVLGIESFPLTCAPMFGHYIDDNTKLYEFKFEGLKNGKTTDLIDYLDKPENHFIRHFFSKAYGSTNTIYPFTNKLSESATSFQNRMNMFFQQYQSTFVLKILI